MKTLFKPSLRRLLLFLLCITMAVPMWAEEVIISPLKYEVSDGKATVLGWATESAPSGVTELTIPGTISHNGAEVNVTKIRWYAFSGKCGMLTSLTIPSGVASIEDGAFSGCSALTDLILPSSVTTIGKYAFEGCFALTHIYAMRATAPTAPTDAFSDANADAKLHLPNGATGYDVGGWESFTSHKKDLYDDDATHYNLGAATGVSVALRASLSPRQMAAALRAFRCAAECDRRPI